MARRRPLSETAAWYKPLKELYAMVREGTGCQKCGTRCCVVETTMTYEEAMVVEDYLEKRPIDFEKNQNLCQFLRPDGTCHIYPVRPLLCRLWGTGKDECRVLGETVSPEEVRAALLRLLNL